VNCKFGAVPSPPTSPYRVVTRALSWLLAEDGGSSFLRNVLKTCQITRPHIPHGYALQSNNNSLLDELFNA
jgi:hypothetical protein